MFAKFCKSMHNTSIILRILFIFLRSFMRIFTFIYLRIILRMQTFCFGNLRICIIMRNSALVCINVYRAKFYQNSHTPVKTQISPVFQVVADTPLSGQVLVTSLDRVAQLQDSISQTRNLEMIGSLLSFKFINLTPAN